jgi:hypothetical protein
MRPFIAAKKVREKISNCIVIFFFAVCCFGPARIEKVTKKSCQRTAKHFYF